MEKVPPPAKKKEKKNLKSKKTITSPPLRPLTRPYEAFAFAESALTPLTPPKLLSLNSVNKETLVGFL